MPQSDPDNIARRLEAKRLLDLARALLTGEDEQIVRDYLDHALAAIDELRS